MSATAAKLRVAPRAILELGQVYTSPLEAFKELIQNALDAKAAKIEIWVKPNEIEFYHNGRPITGEELEAFLTVGTEYKARKGGFIGMYGIGRLSWVMLGKHAKIITNGIVMEWDRDNIMEIRMSKSPYYLYGVRWIITGKNPDIEAKDVERFISENYVGDVPVYVNGKRITPIHKRGTLLWSTRQTKAYLIPERYVMVAKGPFIVWKAYVDTPQGVLFVTSYDNSSVRLNPARKVIEDYEFDKWLGYCLLNTVSALAGKLGLRKVYNEYRELINMMFRKFYWGMSIKEMEKKLPALISKARIPVAVYSPDKGWMVGDLSAVIRSEAKILYVKDQNELDDTILRELSTKYIVICVPTYDMRQVLEIVLGNRFEPAEKYATEMVAKVAGMKPEVVKTVEDVYKSVVSAINEVFATMRVVEEEVARAREAARETAKPGETVVVVDKTGKGGERETSVVVLKGEPLTALKKMGVKFVGKIPETEIAFVEASDPNTLAFTIPSTRQIFINIRNPKVAELIKLTLEYKKPWQRLMIWAPLIVHEMVHQLGLSHTDPAWHEVYEEVLSRVIRKALEMSKEEV